MALYRASPQDGVAWITGASTGIGRALAIRLARKGYTVAATARAEDGLSSITREAEHLDGRIFVFPCDVMNEAAILIARAGRALVVEDTDATLFATPGALAQVLATLIENSLHHGGGTTTVSARSSGANHALVIEVRDEGEGVPDDLAPRIFEREVTSGRGHGLGLALARDLVTADGGRLELSQRKPAVFSVFLQGVPRMVDLEEVVPHSRVERRRGRRRR